MGKAILATALASCALAVATPAAAYTNLLTNGNFEANGGSLASFTVIPGSDIRAIKGSAYLALPGATGASQANNTFASFGAGNDQNVSVLTSDPFATVLGQIYQLTFDYGQFGTEVLQTLKVGITGLGVIGSVTATPGGTDLESIFKTFTFTFTGTGAQTNVFFTLIGSGTNNTDGLLDNVVITAVPEASTWAMMLLGFGLVGANLRRRKTAETRKLALA